MNEWRRDPALIRDFGNQLSALGDALGQMSNNAAQYQGDIGAPNVARAFADIANNWWVIRDEVSKELHSAADALHTIATTYEQDEQTIINHKEK